MPLTRAYELCETFSDCLKEGLLRKWYPLVIDRECGGYFTNVTFDWRLSPEQEKMIVTQARHIWTTAKAASFVADAAAYEAYARHGLEFLRTFMWDGVHGGFFQIRSRQGGYSECEGWREEKRTNGQAYAIRKTGQVARTLNSNLDHVSFGHECEAAYLMLEASYALGIENDARTLSIAKRMLEHALMNGWDEHVGGLYDAGYYLEGSDQCSAVKKTKSWWVQAEALNALLIFSRIFPHDKVYRELFEKLWAYIDKYLLDHQNGDWYEAGLDTEPRFITGPKSHMWKCTYHTGRALMNCIVLLSDEDRVNPNIGKRKTEMERLINHWKKT